MHPNSIYRQQDDLDALGAATERGFGVVTAQLDTLFGAHVPFVQIGERLHLHFHRGNPLAKAATKDPVQVCSSSRSAMPMSALIGMPWRIRCRPGSMARFISMAV